MMIGAGSLGSLLQDGWELKKWSDVEDEWAIALVGVPPHPTKKGLKIVGYELPSRMVVVCKAPA